MRHTALDGPRATAGEFDARDQFKVVILYDRPGAGRRAMNQLRKVTVPLAGGLELQVRLWRLGVVMNSSAATTVAEDLATADLLVFTLEDDSSLNGDVRERLLEAVHQMRTQGAAVAILMNDDDAAAPSRFDFLHDAAQEAGVGFLFPPARSVAAATKPAAIAIPVRTVRRPRCSKVFLHDIHSRPR